MRALRWTAYLFLGVAALILPLVGMYLFGLAIGWDNLELFSRLVAGWGASVFVLVLPAFIYLYRAHLK